MSYLRTEETNVVYSESADENGCGSTPTVAASTGSTTYTIKHNDDGGSGLENYVVSVPGTDGLIVIKDPTTAYNQVNTATKHSLLCAQACNVIPGCNFVAITDHEQTGTGASGCTALQTCTLTATSTANQVVLTKHTHSDLFLTALSGDWQNTYTSDAGVKCKAATDPVATDAVAKTFQYNGADKTLTIVNGLFTWGANSDIPDATSQQAYCAAACSVYPTCKYVNVLNDGSSTLSCMGFLDSGCTAALTSSDVLDGTDHDAILTKGTQLVHTTNTFYEVTAGNGCAASDASKKSKTTSADGTFSIDTDNYKVKIENNDGVMVITKQTGGSGTFDPLVQANGDAQALVFEICTKACSALPGCTLVDHSKPGAAQTCTAYAEACSPANPAVATNNILSGHGMPTNAPTKEPTKNPSTTPSSGPSSTPTAAPSSGPSNSPSLGPSNGPTKGPSPMPSAPTVAPSSGPSRGPAVPTDAPSGPTNNPSPRPSQPTENPTPKPTQPTPFPSRPTKMPVKKPTPAPTHPTPAPTRPTPAPTAPTPAPTVATAVESDVETTSASSTIMALQVVVFLAWALF